YGVASCLAFHTRFTIALFPIAFIFLHSNITADIPITGGIVSQAEVMTSFYFPFALTVGGMLFYHLAQKSIPKEINPFYATIIAYALGIALCAICALTYPGKKSFVDSVRESNWAVFVLGAAAACIEIGFLLAYRAGWRLSVAAVATNVAVTAMLVPIGVIIFKDQLSLRNILVLILCVLGLVLVVRD